MERNGRNHNTHKSNFPNRFQHRNQLKKPYTDYNNPNNKSSTPSIPLKSHNSPFPSNQQPHFNAQGQSPNNYNKSQGTVRPTRTPLVAKNYEPFFTPGYYGPEQIATMLNKAHKDPEQQQVEILGFKVVHDGRVVHDEMPKGLENDDKKEIESWNRLGAVNSPKYNEVPNSIEISLPSFSEC